MSDPINPHHYKQHPSGVEAIEICEHFSFCLGNAIKYIWRANVYDNIQVVEAIHGHDGTTRVVLVD